MKTAGRGALRRQAQSLVNRKPLKPKCKHPNTHKERLTDPWSCRDAWYTICNDCGEEVDGRL